MSSSSAIIGEFSTHELKSYDSVFDYIAKKSTSADRVFTSGIPLLAPVPRVYSTWLAHQGFDPEHPTDEARAAFLADLASRLLVPVKVDLEYSLGAGLSSNLPSQLLVSMGVDIEYSLEENARLNGLTWLSERRGDGDHTYGARAPHRYRKRNTGFVLIDVDTAHPLYNADEDEDDILPEWVVPADLYVGYLGIPDDPYVEDFELSDYLWEHDRLLDRLREVIGAD